MLEGVRGTRRVVEGQNLTFFYPETVFVVVVLLEPPTPNTHTHSLSPNKHTEATSPVLSSGAFPFLGKISWGGAVVKC